MLQFLKTSRTTIFKHHAPHKPFRVESIKLKRFESVFIEMCEQTLTSNSICINRLNSNRETRLNKIALCDWGGSKRHICIVAILEFKSCTKSYYIHFCSLFLIKKKKKTIVIVLTQGRWEKSTVKNQIIQVYGIRSFARV